MSKKKIAINKKKGKVECLGTKLVLGFKLANFEKSWTWLTLTKTLGYVIKIYLKKSFKILSKVVSQI